MLKVGIITIISDNFGNRLQNYALEKVLEKLGVYPETFFLNEKECKVKILLKNLIRNIIIVCKPDKFVRYQRRKKFNEFNKKYIHKSKYTLENINSKNTNSYAFDYVICGSDQIWNYSYSFINENFFASNIQKNKKLSYAASFGVDSVPEPYAKNFSNWINDFKAVSVRENKGREIVYDLTGRAAEVVLDPTLMLNKNEWLAIEEKNEAKKPYILVYLLGELSEGNSKAINAWAVDYKQEIININSNSILSPSEFIGLINGSSLVVTDSFHACVFSVIMQVPFVVCDRKDDQVKMSSRIDTLLSLLKFDDRRMENVKNIFDMDFTHVEGIINREQEKSYKFLKEALEINTVSENEKCK